jgi:hypothetical protein
MYKAPTRSLRALFLTLMTLLVAFVAVETALTPTAEARAGEGLSSCGTEAAPCLLAPVAVEVDAGGEEQLVSTASVRQMLRVGS